MKNNNQTSICIHEETNYQHGQHLTNTNGTTWDFAQHNEMEWNLYVNSFQVALDVKEETLDKNHIDVASASHNMAVGLDDVGEHEDSLNCYMR